MFLSLLTLYLKVLFMEDKDKYLEDLKDIKQMMQRSSRFISLSGMSGIVQGIIAIIAAWVAYVTVYQNQDYLGYRKADLSPENLAWLLGTAMVTLVLSIGIGVFFTTRKARKNNQSIWDMQSRLMIINLLIPLATGGILCLILLSKGYVGLIAPLTLIFYGLALVNGSKYTLGDIRGLGLIEIALGLLASYFIGYGLLFWALGFGLMHIVYGTMMHFKYGS